MTEAKMRRIIRRLDAAAEALSELMYDPDFPESRGRDDGRDRLRSSLVEYSNWLERSKWWRKTGKAQGGPVNKSLASAVADLLDMD